MMLFLDVAKCHIWARTPLSTTKLVSSNLSHTISSIPASPYSSWGHSFDDLFCGPGQICAGWCYSLSVLSIVLNSDEWTPLPSRTQSLSPPRRRHSVAVSPGGAEVYTVRRKSFNGVIDEQPLPIEGASIR